MCGAFSRTGIRTEIGVSADIGDLTSRTKFRFCWWWSRNSHVPIGRQGRHQHCIPLPAMHVMWSVHWQEAMCRLQHNITLLPMQLMTVVWRSKCNRLHRYSSCIKLNPTRMTLFTWQWQYGWHAYAGTEMGNQQSGVGLWKRGTWTGRRQSTSCGKRWEVLKSVIDWIWS